jgi:hypothetical protein
MRPSTGLDETIPCTTAGNVGPSGVRGGLGGLQDGPLQAAEFDGGLKTQLADQ